MDNLQYVTLYHQKHTQKYCFKPYYKWITFNTKIRKKSNSKIILGFKPYYKWITFNTKNKYANIGMVEFKVLTLIING